MLADWELFQMAREHEKTEARQHHWFSLSASAASLHRVFSPFIKPIFPLLGISPSLFHSDTEHHLLSAAPPSSWYTSPSYFTCQLYWSAQLLQDLHTVLTQMLVIAPYGCVCLRERNCEFDWQWQAWLAWILICCTHIWAFVFSPSGFCPLWVQISTYGLFGLWEYWGLSNWCPVYPVSFCHFIYLFICLFISVSECIILTRVLKDQSTVDGKII